MKGVGGSNVSKPEEVKVAKVVESTPPILKEKDSKNSHSTKEEREGNVNPTN